MEICKIFNTREFHSMNSNSFLKIFLCFQKLMHSTPISTYVFPFSGYNIKFLQIS